MASDFQLSIVSPAREVYQGPAKSAVLPAKDGSMGIQPNHAPMIALLGSGTLRFQTEAGTETYFLSGGFLEVKSNKVTVLADEIQKPEELSLEKLQTELEALRAMTVVGEEDIENHLEVIQVVRNKINAAGGNQQ
ncbi:MAG: ATP synthase F1 subunit epsilon [Spirochaetaceae bacterium]|nr:ATP synthase F1 subunit epsilon [Spirochaetaceae bacterium]|tara:strand:- start:71000 stop:71404 length:405 start_codon:yes stop_codon:yes gene_type:complete